VTPIEAWALAQASYDLPATIWRDDIHVLARDAADGAVELGFRGSASFIDWVRNAMAQRGWWGDVSRVLAQLNERVGDRPLRLAAHSKGAAEAQDYAGRRIKAGLRVDELWTFGAPGVGPLGGRLAHVPGVDYRNKLDPVPTLPPGAGHPRIIVPIGVVGWRDRAWPVANHFLTSYRESLPA
jgi:hypothetical protein